MNFRAHLVALACLSGTTACDFGSSVLPPCGPHDASVSDIVLADAPRADVVDAAATDIPVADTPVADTPVADTPVADTPLADVVPQDSGRACPPGSSICNMMCVDLQTNNSHCGVCDKRCPALFNCVGGSCVGMGVCLPPMLQCGATCIDPLTSNSHCGRCNNACGMAQTCVNGSCVNNGALRFTLTWSVPADVDLQVVAPCGMTVERTNRMACEGSLDRDDTSGTGPENIAFTMSAARGDYHVCAVPFNLTAPTSITLQIWEGTSLIQSLGPTPPMALSMPNPPPCTPSSPFFVTTYRY